MYTVKMKNNEQKFVIYSFKYLYNRFARPIRKIGVSHAGGFTP